MGATPLYVAAQFGQVEAIKLLLEHGAVIEEKTNVDSFTFMIIVTVRIVAP
jgi:ankyrin repeat protein